jgi:hypothetical protein
MRTASTSVERRAIEQAVPGVEHAPNVAELVELLTSTVTPALD